MKEFPDEPMVETKGLHIAKLSVVDRIVLF